MRIDKVVVGPIETNCYILSIDDECIVIDPGDEIDKIKIAIGNKKVIGVIITHYHFDHIGAIEYFDNDLILDIHSLDEKEYIIGKFNFEVIYTPGHKKDSITIYFKKEKVMFTGDFIFKDAIGRTDLDDGNINDMYYSLKKISKYPKDTKVYPGHGDITELGYELTKY